MATYHCSLRTFSRAEGHSAVAAAAYRSGSILRDERTGTIHRYEKRHGVKAAFILAPDNAPENLKTRAALWNAVEASETRKNSRVAREVILALPHELSDQARRELSCDMGLYLLERYRVAVDVAIHAPSEGDGHDPRNHHAHILFTTREITKDGLGAKTRVLDDKVSGPQEVEIIREVWETLANDALTRAGFAETSIDRRTLEDQGIERIPQTHEGKAARNASLYESRLTKAFKEAEQSGSKEDDDDEGDGKKDSSSSSSSSGDKNPKLQSKAREDHTGRKIDYPSLDEQKTRLSFNAEIKALNERRAAFGEKPLTEQIAQLDRLMERLDARLEKLQTLETRTTLKAAIKESIVSAVKFAAALFIGRAKSKAALQLTAQEKHARTERHITRYGRTYREGLHQKIQEMKQNINILEQKQEDFKRYKGFVDTIAREVRNNAPLVTEPLREQSPPIKQVSDTEINLKLHLKAEMIRVHIPEQFKPPALTTGEQQTLTASTAVNKILQAKGEPIRIDKDSFAAPESQNAQETKADIQPTQTLEAPKNKPEIKLQITKSEAPPIIKPETRPEQKQEPVLQLTKVNAPPVREIFTTKAEIPVTAKVQAEYKQPMTVKIKALEQAIAQRQTARIETSKPEDRKSWFIPATEKTKPMMEAIDKAIKEQRIITPDKAERPTYTLRETFTKIKEPPQKMTTYSAVREKTRTEAQTSKTHTSFTNASATTATQTIVKPSKPKMSESFNAKAFAHNAPPQENHDLDGDHNENPDSDSSLDNEI